MTDSDEAGPNREASSHPRRRWPWIAGAVLVVCAGLLAWPIASGRTSPPTFTRESARHALEEARRSAAPKWAASSLSAAESAFRASLLEERLQQEKLLPFRDYRRTRVSFDLAEKAARRAISEGNLARATARDAAQTEIDSSHEVVARIEEIGDAIHLPTFERVLLRKTVIALDESRYLFSQGEYNSAAARAREAGTQAKTVSERAVQYAARFAEPGTVRLWQRQVRDTVNDSARSGGSAIIVLKENHRLELYRDGRLVRSYRADMGYRSFNDKLRAGDAATPEGRYRITTKRGPGSATYYKAFDLDYPNSEDRAQFERLRRAGRIPRGARLGGSIQIHGEGGRGKDWTRGCVALSNSDMDDLFRRVEIGTPVTIVGGDGRGLFAEMVREHQASGGGGAH